MYFEILAGVISGVLSLAFGFTAIDRKLEHWLRISIGRFLKLPPPKEETFSQRLSRLTASLNSASAEVDNVIRELASAAQDRQSAVARLEADVAQMERRETELKVKIAALEQTPLPVAEHFAAMMKSTDRSSARRDYMLFGAGVLVSTVIAVCLQLLFGS